MHWRIGVCFGFVCDLYFTFLLLSSSREFLRAGGHFFGWILDGWKKVHLGKMIV